MYTNGCSGVRSQRYNSVWIPCDGVIMATLHGIAIEVLRELCYTARPRSYSNAYSNGIGRGGTLRGRIGPPRLASKTALDGQKRTLPDF